MAAMRASFAGHALTAGAEGARRPSLLCALHQ
jgi:hypothetical protein